MNEERWLRIHEAFTAAADKEPEERGEYLDRLRGEDPELAAEVEALLEADAEAPDFLETPPPVPSGLADRRAGGLGAGDRVGPYSVIRELGRGGMGGVYLAERADGQFEQRVAVKLLRPGLDAGDMEARFLAERQILASLEHPAIARLLDGGTAADGRPYLAMEYVEGRPVLAWCDERSVPVEERLELFIEICRAVGYAHRNLLVHRDLKTSNILVTDEGTPKLLDFGIAKLLEGSEVPGGAPPTRTGRHLMTPDCASPEQVRGEPVTTASDVYQLGLLLYELLAGERAYRLGGRTPGEVEEVVCETRPEPPSRRVSELRTDPSGERARRAREIARDRSTRAARLEATLAGDLDTIVSTALRKEPERRYASADRLADDLERYLEGRPVSARADTWRYRASRFVRRNRGAVSAAAGIALLLVALAALSVRYAVTTAEQSRAIAAERDRARTEAARAEQVTEFMVSLFESALPGAGRRDTLTVRAVLDRAGDRIDGGLEDRPEVRAALLTAVGRIQYGLGDVDEGQARVARGLALRRDLHDGPHPALVESLYRLAAKLQEGYQFTAADTLYREALDVHRQLPDPDSLRTAEVLQGWGATLRDLDRPDSAVALVREAVEIRRRLQGEGHAGYLVALARLAYALRGTGELEEAERLYREAIAGQRALGDSARVGLESSLNDLAVLLAVERGEDEAAVPLYREAIAIRDELYGEAHRETLMYRGNLAGALADAGRLDEAEAVLRESVDLARRRYADSTWQVGAQHGRVGSLLFQAGEYASAEEAYRAERAVFAADLGPDHLWTAVAESSLGGALLLSGREEAGRRLLVGSLPVLERRPRRVANLIHRGVVGTVVDRLRARGDSAVADRYAAFLDGAP